MHLCERFLEAGSAVGYALGDEALIGKLCAAWEWLAALDAPIQSDD